MGYSHGRQLNIDWSNSEKVRKYYRDYTKSNPDKIIKWNRKYRVRYPKKLKEKLRRQKTKHGYVYNLIYEHPENYPLDDECVFCGQTEKLEHAHLDYEDKGFNYLTACHRCNIWMDKSS